MVAATLIVVSSCGSSDDARQSRDTPLDLVLTNGPEAQAREFFGEPVAGQSIAMFYLNGDGSQRWAREQLIHSLISECMSERGYQYPPIAFNQSDIMAEVETMRFHVPLSVADANTTGYVGPQTARLDGDRQAQVGTPSSIERDQPFLDAEYDCGAAAIDSSYVDREQYQALNDQLVVLLEEFYDAFWTAEPVLALNQEWAECIRSVGIEADSPDVLRGRALRLELVEQIDIATKDAECRERTNYDSSIIGMLRSADAAFAVEHSELLRAVHEAGEIPVEGRPESTGLEVSGT